MSNMDGRALTDQRVRLQAAAELGTGETQVFLFSRSSDLKSPEVRRINLTTKVANRFRESAGRWAHELGSRTLVKYDPGRTPSVHEVAQLEITNHPVIQTIAQLVSDPIQVPLYSTEDAGSFLRNLSFYIVAAQTTDQTWFYFLKTKTETLRLKRTRRIALIASGNAYDELDEDLLVFGETYDALLTSDSLFVINQTSVERALGLVAEARAVAMTTLSVLLSTVAVANASDLVAAATTDLNMISKLRSITSKMTENPAYASAMTTERILAFARERKITVDTESVNGVPHLVFHPDPQRRWRILKLLDDDYLDSALTDINYEVNSKSPI